MVKVSQLESWTYLPDLFFSVSYKPYSRYVQEKETTSLQNVGHMISWNFQVEINRLGYHTIN
jgi:hypothetical protein